MTRTLIGSFALGALTLLYPAVGSAANPCRRRCVDAGRRRPRRDRRRTGLLPRTLLRGAGLLSAARLLSGSCLCGSAPVLSSVLPTVPVLLCGATPGVRGRPDTGTTMAGTTGGTRREGVRRLRRTPATPTAAAAPTTGQRPRPAPLVGPDRGAPRCTSESGPGYRGPAGLSSDISPPTAPLLRTPNGSHRGSRVIWWPALAWPRQDRCTPPHPQGHPPPAHCRA